MGEEEYRRLLRQVGEDRILKQMVKSLTVTGQGQEMERRKGFWRRYGWVVILVLVLVGTALSGLWEVLYMVVFVVWLVYMLATMVGSLLAKIAEWWNNSIPRF